MRIILYGKPGHGRTASWQRLVEWDQCMRFMRGKL